MKEDLVHQIKKVVDNWENDLRDLVKRKDIIVVNFGAQKVFNGYELYLSGHTWFDGNDLWLLDEEWSPSTNYISLGQDSLNCDRLYVLKTLETIIEAELKQSTNIYKHLIVTIGLVDSDYKRLK